MFNPNMHFYKEPDKNKIMDENKKISANEWERIKQEEFRRKIAKEGKLRRQNQISSFKPKSKA